MTDSTNTHHHPDGQACTTCAPPVDDPAATFPAHVCETYDPECTCREDPALTQARYLGAAEDVTFGMTAHQSALELERELENRVDALRIKSERAS